MNEEQAIKVLAATVKDRRIAAIVVGPSFDILRNKLFLPVLDELLQSVKRSGRGMFIELYNGSRFDFVIPQEMSRRLLETPGIKFDIAWIHAELTKQQRAYLLSRCNDATVIIETR